MIAVDCNGVRVEMPADTPTGLRALDGDVLTIAEVLEWNRGGWRTYDARCPYTMSHTKYWCRYEWCPDG